MDITKKYNQEHLLKNYEKLTTDSDDCDCGCGHECTGECNHDECQCEDE